MEYANLAKKEFISTINKFEYETYGTKKNSGKIFRQVGMGITHVSGQGKLTKVNEKFARMFGHGAYSMFNMHVSKISQFVNINMQMVETQKIWLEELSHFIIEKNTCGKITQDFGAVLLNHC